MATPAFCLDWTGAAATASAGPGGASASASAKGDPVESVPQACAEAVQHAQAGNCFAAQIALMAAHQGLPQGGPLRALWVLPVTRCFVCVIPWPKAELLSV